MRVCKMRIKKGVVTYNVITNVTFVIIIFIHEKIIS